MNAIENGVADFDYQKDFNNLLSKIEAINDDITNNIKPDIENLKGRVLVNEQNIDSLLTKVTNAEEE